MSVVSESEFGPPVNDALFDATEHAAMLEEAARHPERVIAWGALAFVVWAAGMAIFS